MGQADVINIYVGFFIAYVALIGLADRQGQFEIISYQNLRSHVCLMDSHKDFQKAISHI